VRGYGCVLVGVLLGHGMILMARASGMGRARGPLGIGLAHCVAAQYLNQNSCKGSMLCILALFVEQLMEQIWL
jgi:hypothetical protein